MGMEEAPDGAPRIDESGVQSEVYRCYSDVETLERGVHPRQSPLRDLDREACVILLFGRMATEQEIDLHGERRLVDGELRVLAEANRCGITVRRGRGHCPKLSSPRIRKWLTEKQPCLYTPRTVWKADGVRQFEVDRGRGEEAGARPVRRRGHLSSGILMIWCHSLLRVFLYVRIK